MVVTNGWDTTLVRVRTVVVDLVTVDCTRNMMIDDDGWDSADEWTCGKGCTSRVVRFTCSDRTSCVSANGRKDKVAHGGSDHVSCRTSV